MKRNVKAELIENRIRDGFKKINFVLPSDVKKAIEEALKKETVFLARFTLENILKNNQIAGKNRLPLCQDCGLAVVYVEIGEDVNIRGSMADAIRRGVKEAYAAAFLRKSVCCPLTRENTRTNLPPVIHYNLIKGDSLKIYIMSKGGGSDNKSRLKMLTPSDGIEGIMDFVCETVKKAGSSACPPYIVGVGIGGSFDTVSSLAKRALFRKIGSGNRDKTLKKMEKEILKRINRLNIGAGGFGGVTTALAVHIDSEPCHIASLPVAVNINCHSARSLSLKF
ncbi:MAG: fumarate hydratase [Candidatus Aureabacteria bacterium]|nr:fumarate hydratase [Candidatus Auribacterota bacterium]